MFRRAIPLLMCLAVAAALTISPASHLHASDGGHEVLLHTHFEPHPSSSATPDSVTEADHASNSIHSIDLFIANKGSAAPVVTIALVASFELKSPSGRKALYASEQVRVHGPPAHASPSLRAPPASARVFWRVCTRQSL